MREQDQGVTHTNPLNKCGGEVAALARRNDGAGNFRNKYEKSQEIKVKEREYTVEEMNRELEKTKKTCRKCGDIWKERNMKFRIN